MKKIASAAALIIALLLVFAGCSNASPDASASASAAASASASAAASASASPSGKTIAANGADYVTSLVNEFAKSYNSAGVTITATASNSNNGIAALAEDTAQIALSSRALKDAEKSTFAGMKEQEICKDGIAVVVGKDNPISALTAQQVKDIFTKSVTDWGDAGGTAGTIKVYTLGSTSDVRKVFNELLLGKDEDGKQIDTTDSLNTIEDSNEKMAEALAGDSAGIGYMQLSSVPADGSLKVLDIDGVKATAANIKSGAYTYALSFNLITKGDADAQAFVDYCLGSDAKEHMTASGYIVP